MKKLLLFFALVLSLMGVTQAWGETITEDFEEITLVDADGNELASAWSYGYGMSNGWKIVGGKIYAGAGNTDYGIWSIAHAGSKSLEASYGASNAASVYIPKMLTGEVKFWARKTSTSSSTKGTITIFEADEDGNVSTTKLYTNSNLTTTWTQYTLDLGEEGKYIAINMIRAGLDDFEATEYEEADGPKLGVFSDAACSKKAVATHDYGLTTAPEALTYYVKNTGTGTETLTAEIAVTGAYTLSATSVSLGADESQEITVTPPTTGDLAGTLTITPTVEGLNPFTVTITGAVRDASKIFIDFEDNDMPETWNMESGWSKSSSGYATSSYSASNITSGLIKVAEGGENLMFKYKGNSTWSTGTVTVYYATTGNGSGADWKPIGEAIEATYGVWQTATVAVPAEAKYIAFNGKYIDIDDIYGLEEPQVAQMSFTPADYSFGMVGAEKSQTFTIKNIGAATLTNLTAESSDANFTVAVANSIEAKSSTDLTVTMKVDNKGALNGVITVKADDQEDVTFNVSGYVADDTKMLVTFDDNKKPEGWEENSAWTYSNGAAYTTSRKTLTSPKIKVAEGEVLAINAKQAYSGSYYGITVKGSSDNGETWTAYSKELTNSYFNTTDFAVAILNDIPATVNKLQFEGYYVYIDAINGFTIDANDPKLAVFSDEALTQEVATGTAIDLGFTTEAFNQTYYLANTKTGTLTITNIAAPEGITAEKGSETVNAGEKTTLTVSIPTTPAVYDGNIEITTDGGNFTIPVKGVMMDPERFFIDFTSADIPSDWTATDWSKSANGYIAPTGYSTKNMETAVMEAEANEIIVIKAKGSSYSGTLAVNYKAEDAEDWTTLKSSESFGDTNWHIYTVTIPEAGKYQLQIAGYYAQIEKIYGMKEVQEPKLLVKDGDTELATGDKVEFGAVKESVTKTITIENTGAAALEVSSIASDNDAFTVDKTSVNVNAKGNTTFNITFNYNANDLGSKTGNITLTNNATAEPFTIAVSAMALAADAWQVDFENGVPEGWYNKGWEITNPSSHYYYTASKGASSSYSNDNILVTPLLETNANDVLSLETRANSNANDYTLTVEYSADRETWNTLTTLTSTSSIERQEIVVPETGKFYLRFSGKNNIIDNLAGLKLAEVSHDLYKTAESLPTEGTTGEAYEASISVKNLRNTEESATAELYIDDELKATTAEAATVSALGTATLPVSWTPEEAGTYKAKVVVRYGDNQTVESAEQEFTVVLATLTLAETSATQQVVDGNYNVKLSRTVYEGWNTIILPFDLTEEQMKATFGDDVELYEYTDCVNGALSIIKKSTANLVAGTPYVIWVSKDIYSYMGALTFNNVQVSTTINNVSHGDFAFKGSYEYIASMEGLYGVTSDAHIAKGGSTNYMYGYRAYFEPTTAGAKLTGLVVNDGETTSIVGIEKLNMQNGDIYSLSGRKMNSGVSLPAGVYIQNGKKIIVK